MFSVCVITTLSASNWVCKHNANVFLASQTTNATTSTLHPFGASVSITLPSGYSLILPYIYINPSANSDLLTESGSWAILSAESVDCWQQQDLANYQLTKRLLLKAYIWSKCLAKLHSYGKHSECNMLTAWQNMVTLHAPIRLTELITSFAYDIDDKT